MSGWYLVALLIALVAGLPFYVYLLSKFAAVGRLAGTRSFVRNIKGEDCGKR